jgi:hypothetical protein
LSHPGPRYNWNIVESGVKHYKPTNQTINWNSLNEGNKLYVIYFFYYTEYKRGKGIEGELNCRLIRLKCFVYNKRGGSAGVRHSILYAVSVGVMNWIVREKDDYMFLYEKYYLFSYIIDISVDFEPHFYK